MNGATRVNIENSQMQIIRDLSESDGKVNWDDVWDHTANSVTCSSSSRHGNGVDSTLPDALRNLEYVFFSNNNIPLQMPCPSAHQP